MLWKPKLSETVGKRVAQSEERTECFMTKRSQEKGKKEIALAPPTRIEPQRTTTTAIANLGY